MITAPLVKTAEQPGEPYRWSRAEYEKMVEIGLFPPQARLELIEGKILQMASQTSYHATALTKAADALRAIFRAGYHVRRSSFCKVVNSFHRSHSPINPLRLRIFYRAHATEREQSNGQT